MKLLISLLTAAAAIAMPSAANAAIVINIPQVGANVVATGSGSFNTAGLTFTTENAGNGLNGSLAVIRFGAGSADALSSLAGITGPAAFGTISGFRSSTTAVGDRFGVARGQIILPVGYTSGAQLAGTLTFANATLTSLGLTIGSYVYRAQNDTLTINIGLNAVPAAVPEPASWAMMIMGMGAVGGVMRRRAKVSTRVAFAA